MSAPTPSPVPVPADPTSWPDAFIIVGLAVCITIGAIFFFKYMLGD